VGQPMLAGVPFGDGFQPSTGVSTFGDGSRPSWGRRTQRVPRLPTARSTRASRLDSLRSLRRLGFHIANDTLQPHFIPHAMVEGFILPEDQPRSAEDEVGVSCGGAFQPARNHGQGGLGPKQYRHVVGHDHPGSQWIDMSSVFRSRHTGGHRPLPCGGAATTPDPEGTAVVALSPALTLRDFASEPRPGYPLGRERSYARRPSFATETS
jgi:hypothetical protein